MSCRLVCILSVSHAAAMSPPTGACEPPVSWRVTLLHLTLSGLRNVLPLGEAMLGSVVSGDASAA